MNDIQFKESMVQSRAGMYKLFPNICGYVWSGTDDVFGGDNSFCFFWTNVFCSVWQADERWNMKLTTMCLRFKVLFSFKWLRITYEKTNPGLK